MAAGEGCWRRPKTGAAAITEGGPEVLAAQGASANPAAACPVATWHTPSRPFCATYSLASAVHAFGDDVAAVAIAAKAEQASKSADALAVLRDHINGPAVPGWQARLVKKAAERNVLEPSYQPVSEPLLLQIGSEHAVALLERTIFDNNHPHGLPLSRESLDYVLQRSRCVEDSFSHVRRAVRLMAGQSVRKAIGKRKRDECNE